MTTSDTVVGRGTRVFAAEPVRGTWRVLSAPDDVLDLMDTSAEGIVACVADAGATFLAPIFDELTGDESFTYQRPVSDSTASCVQTRQVHYVSTRGASG